MDSGTIEGMESYSPESANEARQRALVLETANRVALDILAQETGVDALRHIAEAARALVGARYAALGVANPNGDGLEEFITAGLTPSEEAAIGPRPRGLGVLGLLLKRTEPLRIAYLSTDPASVGFPANHPPMNSFLGVPIRRGDTVLGSLYLTDKEDGQLFTEADADAVAALGAHAAVAIHHARLLSRQRALLSSLINAQEEERRAIAYDLHDGLTQYVMAAYAHLEAYRAEITERQEAEAKGEYEEETDNLAQGVKYLKEAVVESRRLVNGLRALALDDLGLAGALEQLLREEKQRAGWQHTDFLHNIAGRRFDRTLETTVYRVAQEALTNARKHAEANRVWVVVLLEAGTPGVGTRLTLEVRDWGRGFRREERVAADGPHGFGLHGMIERIHLIGGTHELGSAPGEGTRVFAVFPVDISDSWEGGE